MFLLVYILYRLLDVMSFVLMANAIMSWFPGAYGTPLGRFLANLAEPILRPFRSLRLQFAGLDFSVFAAILVLNFLGRLLVSLLYML